MYRGYGDNMPTRMERYYKTEVPKSRTVKNRDLYRTIYDEAEYSNVEGISIIEKNEKIDIDMIKELINGSNNKPKPTREMPERIIKEETPKNYDIMDVLSKAKSERTDKERKINDTQYNILKNINLDEDIKAPSNVDEDDLKNMIEAISNNSKNYTGDLLDDLKTSCDPNLKKEVDNVEQEIDQSFYTTNVGFSSNDFEDLKEMKDDIKKNNTLTKVLLFILSTVIVTAIIFLVYHFTRA